MNRELYTIRRAELRDTEALVDLVNGAYRGESARKGWTTESDLLAGQRTDQEQIQSLIVTGEIWLAERDAELRGCVFFDCPTIDKAYLGMLTVRPTEQGSGLGRRLLQRIEERARETNRKQIEMTVIAQRPELIAWYERVGFRQTGETRPFPYGDKRFGQPLRDDLYFVVLEKTLPLNVNLYSEL